MTEDKDRAEFYTHKEIMGIACKHGVDGCWSHNLKLLDFVAEIKESSRKELEAEMVAHAATIQREARLSLEKEALEKKLAEYENELGILTVNRAREFFDYDPTTGILTWRISKGTIKAGSAVTSINCKGYMNVKVGHKTHQAHRIAWMVHYGETPQSEIDHINRVKTDNRIENLRCVSHSENMFNTHLRPDNKSGHKGVYKMKNKWGAQIRVQGKAINLGIFDDIESAVIARKQGEEKYLCKTK